MSAQEEWSEVNSLKQRIDWMQAEISSVKADGRWWEDRYMAELSARYRAIQYAADRGVYIPTDL